MLNLAVVGTGYVGLINAVCFAGHKSINHVTCIDIDAQKIDKLRSREIPIYEPSLKDIFDQFYDVMTFTTEFEKISDADIVFICVPTPSLPDGGANLSYLVSATSKCAPHLRKDALFVIKSTVPPGTAAKIKKLIPQKVVNNPEFLREGSAVSDFFTTDRVVIGTDDEKSVSPLVELFRELDSKTPILVTSNESAELIKYASNTFLACKISFINEIALLSEKIGANITDVQKGMALDSRIGDRFLTPSAGYGGSCFPKDVKALSKIGTEFGVEMLIATSTDKANERQKNVLWEKICNHYSRTEGLCPPKGKRFAFWGVAFKDNTDDVRDSVAISLARKLIDAGNTVVFHDPLASANFIREVHEAQESSGLIDTVWGADALVILVDNYNYTLVDLEIVKEKMVQPVIFDGRNILKKSTVLSNGFTYYGIGKNYSSG